MVVLQLDRLSLQLWLVSGMDAFSMARADKGLCQDLGKSTNQEDDGGR